MKRTEDVHVRTLAASTGTAPHYPWAAVVPELLVSDLRASIAFWCDVLGFAVAYDRPAAKFAYLERGAAQIMLCERNGRWELGEMRYPLGQGLSLQIATFSTAPIVASLESAGHPLYEATMDVWYRVGDDEFGQREVLVQDPDGYLLRFAQDLGRRAARANDVEEDRATY